MAFDHSPNSSASLLNIPPAPRAPSRKARQLIFAYVGAQKVMLMVGAVFLGIGLIVSLPFCWGIPVDIAIDLGHQEVSGTIRSARLNRNVRINKQHPTTISFAYRVNGREYEDSADTLEDGIIEAAQPGSTFPIQVAKLNPAWARLRGESNSWTGYFGLIILFFPALGATIMGFTIRSNRREIRAFRHGRPVLAKVTSRGQNTRVSVNGRHPFEIAWEFQVDGEIYSGSLSSMSMLAMEDLMAKHQLPVLYDPANPRINTVYIP